MRDSAARGWMKLSSICSAFSACLTTDELIGRVVDDEVARQADGRRLAAQQPRAQRVERRHPHAGCTSEPSSDSTRAAHLFRGLVGEGDGEHFVRLGVAVADQIGDAAGDDARLARSGAGEDQQRALGVKNRVALFGIEGVEELHVGARS